MRQTFDSFFGTLLEEDDIENTDLDPNGSEEITDNSDQIQDENMERSSKEEAVRSSILKVIQSLLDIVKKKNHLEGELTIPTLDDYPADVPDIRIIKDAIHVGKGNAGLNDMGIEELVQVASALSKEDGLREYHEITKQLENLSNKSK